MEEGPIENKPINAMKEYESRDSARLFKIREILQLNELISDKSKLYEIKRILNESLIDFVESRKKLDPTFLQDTPLENLLFRGVA